MATFILISGGWQGAWAFEKVADLLIAHGHNAQPLTLTGLGDVPAPSANLALHISEVDSRPGLWRFNVDDKPHSVTVRGAFRSNAMSAIYAAVTNGLGLGYSPLWQIKDLVDTGRVRLVLEAFEPTAVPIHVLWQDSASVPAKVRAFVDFLVSRLRLGGL